MRSISHCILFSGNGPGLAAGYSNDSQGSHDKHPEHDERFMQLLAAARQKPPSERETYLRMPARAMKIFEGNRGGTLVGRAHGRFHATPRWIDSRRGSQPDPRSRGLCSSPLASSSANIASSRSWARAA